MQKKLPVTAEFKGLYNIRDMVEGDKHFIYSTFLRGLYYGDSWFSLIPKQIFMDNYKKVIEGLIFSPNTTINIACLKDDPNVILGYSITSADFTTIHYVFVKTVWRKKGIAKSLLPHSPKEITHLTTLGKILMPKFKDVIFNPFKL